jgi:hypothetical protein
MSRMEKLRAWWERVNPPEVKDPLEEMQEHLFRERDRAVKAITEKNRYQHWLKQVERRLADGEVFEPEEVEELRIQVAERTETVERMKADVKALEVELRHAIFAREAEEFPAHNQEAALAAMLEYERAALELMREDDSEFGALDQAYRSASKRMEHLCFTGASDREVAEAEAELLEAASKLGELRKASWPRREDRRVRINSEYEARLAQLREDV